MVSLLSFAKNLIQIFHKVTHQSKGNLKILLNKYWWVLLSPHVEQVTSTCSNCQKTDHDKNTKQYKTKQKYIKLKKRLNSSLKTNDL